MQTAPHKIAPTAAAVHAAIASGTDGTFTETGELHTTGYYVGGASTGLSGTRDSFTPEMVMRFVAASPTPYVGVWTDADGTVYLDATEHYYTERAAFNTAAYRQELSVWDIANAREIHVTRTPSLR